MAGFIPSDRLSQKLLIEVLVEMIRFDLENKGDTAQVGELRNNTRKEEATTLIGSSSKTVSLSVKPTT